MWDYNYYSSIFYPMKVIGNINVMRGILINAIVSPVFS